MENEKKVEYIQVRTPDIMKIGEYVVKAKGANRTMAQFAEECGIGASTLSRIANGKIRKPLTEEVIRSIYEHRDEESNITLDTFMRLNGFMEKERYERGITPEREYARNEDLRNRERQMKNAIVMALLDRDIPVVRGDRSTGTIKLKSSFGVEAFLDYKFYIKNAPQEHWCFRTFPQQYRERMPLSFFMDRINAAMTRMFLIDAWEPELLKNVKVSFVFCDEKLYEYARNQFKGAPIKSAMSVILIEAENETIIEETWISSSVETPSVLLRPIQNVEEPEEKFILSPEEYFDSELWRKSDE
mgnify:FL=1